MNVSLDWIKLIQLKPRFLFGLWLFGVFILFIPSEIGKKIGIDDFRNVSKPWLGIATLASFVFWLLQLIPEFQSFYAKRRFRSAVIKSLDFISPEEWIVLAYCLIENQQTITLGYTDRNAGSLVARGILVRANGAGNILSWPHTIPPFLWEYLVKHRDKFMINTPLPKAQVEYLLGKLHQEIHRYDN
jgi:hypothetical protein